MEDRRFGMAGRDYIIGDVSDVVDGETIHMTVDRTGGGKTYGDSDLAKVQIKKLRLTDIAWLTGAFTRSQIEKMIKGKRILCRIKSRDQGGKIIGDVQLIK
jgi:hypothetical protein